MEVVVSRKRSTGYDKLIKPIRPWSQWCQNLRLHFVDIKIHFGFHFKLEPQECHFENSEGSDSYLEPFNLRKNNSLWTRKSAKFQLRSRKGAEWLHISTKKKKQAIARQPSLWCHSKAVSVVAEFVSLYLHCWKIRKTVCVTISFFRCYCLFKLSHPLRWVIVLRQFRHVTLLHWEPKCRRKKKLNYNSSSSCDHVKRESLRHITQVFSVLGLWHWPIFEKGYVFHAI